MNVVDIKKELSNDSMLTHNLRYRVFNHIMRYSNELFSIDFSRNALFIFNKLFVVYPFEFNDANKSSTIFSEFYNQLSILDNYIKTVYNKNLKNDDKDFSVSFAYINDVYKNGAYYLNLELDNIIVNNKLPELIDKDSNYYKSTYYKSMVDELLCLIVLYEYICLKKTDYYLNLAQSINHVIKRYNSIVNYLPNYNNFNNATIDFVKDDINYDELKYHTDKIIKDLIKSVYLSFYAFGNVNQETYISYFFNALFESIRKEMHDYIRLVVFHENIDDKMKLSMFNMINNTIK